MEEQPLISVIIPVYNVEKYLPACLDSVLTQTYRNLEVILVDDGSPDGSGAICDEYAAKDARVRVIHQQNSGASAARNAGLDMASGSFIGFVDADDWIEPHMYQTLYERLLASGADVAQCGYQYHKAGEEGNVYRTGEDRIYTRGQCVEKLLTDHSPWWTLWSKLYRAPLFQGLRFSTELRVSEDAFLIFHLFLKIKHLTFVKEPLYHYIWYPSSLSKFGLKSLDAVQAGQWIAEHIQQSIPRLAGYGYRALAIDAVSLYDTATLLFARQKTPLYKEIMNSLNKSLKQNRSQILKAAECERKWKIKVCFITAAPRLYRFLFPLWLKAKGNGK